MPILEITAIGLVLSADSFSAAIAMGFKPFKKNDALKFAICSGGSEGLVAFVGAMAGAHLISKISTFDHWIAFVLLAMVASHMTYEGLRDFLTKEIKSEKLEFHSFAKILIVSFATSLDALGVGIGLGVAQKTILPYIVSISFFAFAGTILGLNLAKKLIKFGPIVNLIGALILFIMAWQMLKI